MLPPTGWLTCSTFSLVIMALVPREDDHLFYECQTQAMHYTFKTFIAIGNPVFDFLLFTFPLSTSVCMIKA